MAASWVEPSIRAVAFLCTLAACSSEPAIPGSYPQIAWSEFGAVWLQESGLDAAPEEHTVGGEWMCVLDPGVAPPRYVLTHTRGEAGLSVYVDGHTEHVRRFGEQDSPQSFLTLLTAEPPLPGLRAFHTVQGTITVEGFDSLGSPWRGDGVFWGTFEGIVCDLDQPHDPTVLVQCILVSEGRFSASYAEFGGC
ncbi:MAG: hypothetical protein KTR31_13370 [Myxococcales bacterium]|nr:hypothetical protein [Myxococcales bacterium]